MDAVYPFLSIARLTGDEKYIRASEAVFEWSKNVSQPDGSWTVVTNPKSWKGITVFGAIALAKAIHFHGDLLASDTQSRWKQRLKLAAEYVYQNFDLQFANVNYGFTAIYALNFIGRLLDNPAYLYRSRELASQAKQFFTEPNQLLFGEAKPCDRKSAKGLLSVDLGYNVEESLNGITLYALAENDEELLQFLEKSLASHLLFMLPDGGWDNSWGTRQFKWTYWGSRTSDGCQIAYALMADRNAAFGQAARQNTLLMERCTSDDGLLYGGIHYKEHGVPPCIHHTFSHVKQLAYLCDTGHTIKRNPQTIPPPDTCQVKSFPEIDIHLIKTGPWKGTVTNYDFIYQEGVQQATGGALSLLWHQSLGLICAASMARYERVEPLNQQAAPETDDFPLTPRIETKINGEWYTNLYDLKADLSIREGDDSVEITVSTKLTNSQYQALPETCKLQYIFTERSLTIRAQSPRPAQLVLPIISPETENVSRPNSCQLELEKQDEALRLESDSPLQTPADKRERVFNLVPGAQALPVTLALQENEPSEIRLFSS